MKKVLPFLVLISLLVSCVKPNSPIPPNTDIWIWQGNDAMSAEVNGVPWTSDSSSTSYAEMSGWKIVTGSTGSTVISIASKDFAVGGIYPLKSSDPNSVATYLPNLGTGESFSSSTGNDGQCKILENDASHIRGMFYFNSTSPLTGSTIKISKGYFKFKKP